MDVLETSSVLAVLMVAAILLVTRGSRKLRPFRNGRSYVLGEKKPIPEENEENNFFQVIYEPAKIILESLASTFFFQTSGNATFLKNFLVICAEQRRFLL